MMMMKQTMRSVNPSIYSVYSDGAINISWWCAFLKNKVHHFTGGLCKDIFVLSPKKKNTGTVDDCSSHRNAVSVLIMRSWGLIGRVDFGNEAQYFLPIFRGLLILDPVS